MKYKTTLNPDSDFVKTMRQKIQSNSGYCPCKQEKKPENKCPCKDFREHQDCHCGLYIKVKDGDDEC